MKKLIFFLCFGIVIISLVSCKVKHNSSGILDSFSIEGHKYYAECVYQLQEDSLYEIKCFKKGDTLIVVTDNQCIFDNNILSYSNVNNLENRYKEYECSYDTSTLPYFFICTNFKDSILYIGDPVSGLFELESLCIKDTLLSVCDVSVGMGKKDFLQKIIPDGNTLAQEKVSIICIISSHRIKGFSCSFSQNHTTNVMIAYFDDDVLTKLRLDYLWPTDSSFVKETPILERI